MQPYQEKHILQIAEVKAVWKMAMRKHGHTNTLLGRQSGEKTKKRKQR